MGGSLKGLVEAARDLASHQDALKQAQSDDVGWVARRELAERAAAAAMRLDAAVEASYGVGASEVRWYTVGKDSEANPRLINTAAERRKGTRALAAVLSDVCDRRYPLTPQVRNEMLSRRALTSQGAKARRDLLEAMIEHPGEPRSGSTDMGRNAPCMSRSSLAPASTDHTPAAGGSVPRRTSPPALGMARLGRAIIDAFERSASVE